MSLCTGSELCCKLGGKTCPHLVENQAGRRYACGLMIKYQSWESVIRSAEYQPVGEHWESTGQAYELCMTSDPAFCCRPEYRLGRHNQNCEPGCVERVGV